SRARKAVRLTEASVAYVPAIHYMQADSLRYAAGAAGEPLFIRTDAWDLASPDSRNWLMGSDFIVTKSGRAALDKGDDMARVQAFAAALGDPGTDLGRAVEQ